jgi:lipopolysaccharide export system permease protein
VYWGIIHRNILAELLKIFVLALIALTGMILMAGIISEAMKNGFGPLQILAIIPLLLPSLLPYTVPTATLFTTCIVYGRLAADNEILALKAAGIHIRHVIWPALLLGLATSGATMFFYIDVIPATGSLLRNSAIGEPEELLYAILRKENQIKHPRIDWEINVKTMQGRKLQDVIFKRRKFDAKGAAFDVIARAKEAELRWDSARKKILVHMRHCIGNFGDGNSTGYIDQQILEVDVPDDFFGVRVKFRAMDMTWNEMFEYLEKCHADLEKTDDEIASVLSQLSLGKTDPNSAVLLRSLYAEQENRQNQIYSIESEFQMRPALALGCLCFALVGCPVGIWFSKSDYLSAFITCFLPIVIIYYPLMFCMFNMARAGKIPPWMGIYNADAIMLFAGWILFRRLARN